MADEQTRRLARTVHIDGVVYVAGDVPPAEVAQRITNPSAWDHERAASVGNQPSAHDRGGGAVTRTGIVGNSGTKTGLPGGDAVYATSRPGTPPVSDEQLGQAASGEPASRRRSRRP